MNWFIPALVKSSVGSSPGTSGELGTMRWPFCSKNFRNDARISFEVMALYYYRTRLQGSLHHPVGFEALADQVPIQPLKLLVVGDGLAAAEAFGERCLEVRVVVDVAEDLVDGAPRGRRRDARVLDLPADAQLAAAPDRRFGPRDRLRDPHVVDGALLAQARDGGVDGVGVVAAPREPLAHLRLRQLAPREHPEPVEIGGSAGRASRQIG